MDEGHWVTPGSEGSSEVEGVSVEIFSMVTVATPSGGEGKRDGTPSVPLRKPSTSAYSLSTLISIPTGLSPPPAPNLAIDPDVRLVPFTISPTHSPAPVLTSLTP